MKTITGHDMVSSPVPVLQSPSGCHFRGIVTMNKYIIYDSIFDDFDFSYYFPHIKRLP